MSKNWNSNVQFPVDSDFVIRILEASFGPSKSSGNPLLTVPWEIVSPDTKMIGEEEYNMAGIASNPMSHLYFTTIVPNDEESSKNCLDRLTNNGEPLGFLRICFPDNPKIVDGFNPENPGTDIIKGLSGKCLLVSMYGEKNEQRKTPTAAEVAEAKKKNVRPEGAVMKHPVTGKPLVTYLPKIRDIFAIAPEAMAKGIGDKKPY
jgi:hypothetical protein